MISFILVILNTITISSAFSFSAGCPQFCYCEFSVSNLTIQCSYQTNGVFTLPNINELNFLSNTVFLNIKNSLLTNIPANICQFAFSLQYLDLSKNLISENITSSKFGCLKRLEYLYLSDNLIQYIDETSFDDLQLLKTLDLSNNKIETIPTNLFYFKLPNLVYLNLRNNLIKEVDVWMLFLKSIKNIDLSYNQIERLINKIGWNPYFISPYTQLMNADLIDFRFNQFNRFDDSILNLYSICGISEFSYFIRLFNRIIFDENPIECDCKNSFNLLNFYKHYIAGNSISSLSSIFYLKCASPEKYAGLNAFSFENPNQCSNISTYFTYDNCGYRVTTTTTTTATTPGEFIQQNLINQEQKVLQEKINEGIYDSQIAGIVIGLIGILFLFLILLYCICPIEILAICFNCIPFFYSVCPCKSGVRRDKEYDLFISYNRSNEKWVRNVLVKFIQEKYLIKNYILHYNEENKLDEIFGSYIKDIMNRSSCILFVLSDQFLLNEWSNQEFVNHLRHLITREKTRFICIQMHDICDEEVKEYFTDKLQIPRFISLENDEFLFWKKLAYFLYTNNKYQHSNVFNFKSKNRIISQDEIEAISKKREFSSALLSKNATPDLYSSSTSFDLPNTPLRYINQKIDEPKNKIIKLPPIQNKEELSLKITHTGSFNNNNKNQKQNYFDSNSDDDNYRIRHELKQDDDKRFKKKNRGFFKVIPTSSNSRTELINSHDDSNSLNSNLQNTFRIQKNHSSSKRFND